ncbi:hypothetical protein GALMADRAFT_1120554 [Galerina marginata CBS 339.88]|uniref:MARVEL domain-containing protein n=1 Tax=Galerina marginata (strain CBS 339.88) TaxID=685588 RepID=A0A067TD18_GALM3|nr:hypothetical protein GALMADRAFT_1120554 [Galerina marginata CBS 339.88]
MPPTTHARAYAPYPHTASFLSLLSVIFSLSIFALSLLNYSMLALFLNAAATGLALAYHTIVGINNFLEARQPQRSPQPSSISIGIDIARGKLSTSFSLKATVLCAFVCAAWIVAFVVSTQLAIQGPQASTKPLPHAGLWNGGIQIAIACLAGLEFVVMVVYLRMCMMERMRYDEGISHPLCRIPLPLSAEKDLEYGADLKDIDLDSK